MVIRYNDVLTPNEYIKLTELIKGFKWIYGGTSTAKSDASKFWYSELIDDSFFNGFFFNKIKEVTGKNFILKRAYANGQTWGQDGEWHKDSDEVNGYTLLYYCNYSNDVSLIGETYFNVNGEQLAVSPIPNSAVLFSHDLLHKGMAPKQKFNDIRVTIALKLEEIPTT